MSPYREEDFLPLSALQHFLFCRRQCALIHLEGAWDDNRLTVEGRILHERVHEGGNESRVDLRIVRGLRLRSFRLGLVGQADVVEFQRHPLDCCWQPILIEYKRGKPKPDLCDEVQVCAQAICLEEMLSVSIREGAIFYGKPRRRFPVIFSQELRVETEKAARELHELMASQITPPAVYDEKKCGRCSLIHLCMPRVSQRAKSVARYVGAMLAVT